MLSLIVYVCTMLALMWPKVIQPFKAESTDATAVRPFSRVGALVDFQDISPGKALIAHSTLVWFLLRVNASVQLEIPQSAESVSAKRAGVRLVSGLTASVPAQVTEGRVTFPAVTAQVETVALVDALVNLQIAGLSEFLTALVAGVCIIRMRRSVAFWRRAIELERLSIVKLTLKKSGGAIVSYIPNIKRVSSLSGISCNPAVNLTEATHVMQAAFFINK